MIFRTDSATNGLAIVGLLVWSMNSCERAENVPQLARPLVAIVGGARGS